VPLLVETRPVALIVVSERALLGRRVRGSLALLGFKGAVALERAAVAGALVENEKRFRSLVQNSSDVVMIVDVDSAIRYVTPSVGRVLGYQQDDITNTRLTDLLHPEDHAHALSFFAQAANQLGEASIVEWRMRHRDGTWLVMETASNNLLHEPNIGGFVLTTRDVSERKSLEEQLIHQAFRDPVTGLANRALFVDRIQHALARSSREDRALAVLLLDLDDFKTVNDSLGHAAGDRMLEDTGARLQASIRSGDTLARVGGDDFGVLLEDIAGRNDAAEAAERIVSAFRSPFVLGDKEVFVHASIGLAMGGEAGEGADELLRNADTALHTAKNFRRGAWEFFDPVMHDAMLERLELRAALEKAIEGRELVVHYQPIMRLADPTVVGMEALVRWNHPTRGLLSPAEFVPLAEETGLITAIDRWVLEEACRQAVAWQPDGAASGPEVSVNLSARHLQSLELVSLVSLALQSSGLPPGLLILEITESVLMRDTDATVERLRELKELGVRLAIDDFGTGYSSLSYLRRFPVDILKVDKLFVDGLGTGLEESALVHAIVQLSHALGLETIAEGIESAEQCTQLVDLGCELGQGYHFARPMDAEGAVTFLRDSSRPRRRARMPKGNGSKPSARPKTVQRRPKELPVS
jgi:diguanylate cyclase (GGDEF)-like protein/PAS domain S-box-containing protein